MNEIPTFVEAAINDRAHACTCCFWYGTFGEEEDVGTGTLLEHQAQQYLLTCDHVASSFLGSRDTRVSFNSRLELTKNDMEAFKSCPTDDVALLRLSRVVDDLNPVEMSDFALLHDLSAADFSSSAFALTGFPAVLVDAATSNRYVTPLTYFTVEHPSQRQERNKLYLEYPIPHGLPKANGLSGALVRRVTRIRDEGEGVWHAGMTKIVAVQVSAWHSRNYIACTGLRRLFEWLA